MSPSPGVYVRLRSLFLASGRSPLVAPNFVESGRGDRMSGPWLVTFRYDLYMSPC